MLRAIKNLGQSSLAWMLLGFSAFYLVFAFPISFFRHDDWLMIGNVVRIIPQNWEFLFQSHLVFNDTAEIWFFRPWFKLILYLLFQTMGYHYYGWLVVNLLFTLGALLLGYLAISEFTGSTKRALLFVSLFVVSLHFHFASLVWVGEGTMNCPQIFLLFFNLYCFSKFLNASTQTAKTSFYLLGIVAFIFSLGFKEAAIFHLPFLGAILFGGSLAKKFSFRKKSISLLPYFFIGVGYLYFRLYLLPFNPGYKPQMVLSWLILPATYLLISFFIPIFCLLLGTLNSKIKPSEYFKGMLSRVGYAIFFIPFFITYVGHGFFSPGWLLCPGFYLVFLIGLSLPTPLLNKKLVGTSLVFTGLLSGVIVFYQVNKLSWLSWHKPQRQILKIIEDVGTSQTKTLQIFDCMAAEKNETSVYRVVGYPSSIQEIFWLNHKVLPEIQILPCSEARRSVASLTPNIIKLRWSFPEFTVLTH